MTKVLLLEDDQTRVEWLQEHFPSFKITWHMTVKSFVEDYRSSEWDLVVFDYDLTPDFLQPTWINDNWVLNFHQNESARFDCDKDDYNGGDAVMMFPEGNENQKILVWSANAHGAYSMTKNLRAKGYTKVVQQKFEYRGNAKLREIIMELMS